MTGWRPGYLWTPPGPNVNGGIVLSNGNVAVLSSEHATLSGEEGSAPVRAWSTIFTRSGDTYLPVSNHLLMDTTGTAVSGSPTGVWAFDPYPVTLLPSGLVLIAWSNAFGDGDGLAFYGEAPAILSADGTTLLTDILDDPFYGFTRVAASDERVVAYEYDITFVSSFVDDYTDVFHDLGPGATMSKTPLHTLSYGLVFSGDGSGQFKAMTSLSGSNGTMLAVGGYDTDPTRLKMVSVASDGTLTGLLSTTTTDFGVDNFDFIAAGNAAYLDHLVTQQEYRGPNIYSSLASVSSAGAVATQFTHQSAIAHPFRSGLIWLEDGGFPAFQITDGSVDVGAQSHLAFPAVAEFADTIGFGFGQIGFMIFTSGFPEAVVFVRLPSLLTGGVQPGRIRFI